MHLLHFTSTDISVLKKYHKTFRNQIIRKLPLLYYGEDIVISPGEFSVVDYGNHVWATEFYLKKDDSLETKPVHFPYTIQATSIYDTDEKFPLIDMGSNYSKLGNSHIERKLYNAGKEDYILSKDSPPLLEINLFAFNEFSLFLYYNKVEKSGKKELYMPFNTVLNNFIDGTNITESEYRKLAKTDPIAAEKLLYANNTVPVSYLKRKRLIQLFNEMKEKNEDISVDLYDFYAVCVHYESAAKSILQSLKNMLIFQDFIQSIDKCENIDPAKFYKLLSKKPKKAKNYWLSCMPIDLENSEDDGGFFEEKSKDDSPLLKEK